MNQKWKWLARGAWGGAALLVAVLLWSFSYWGGSDMEMNQAYQLWKDGKAVLVDVREKEELEESGLAEGAKWMPTSKFEDKDPEWEAFKAQLPKDKTILLYCRSGARSGRIAEYLKQEGYDTANIGGFKDWLAAKLPVKNFSSL